MQRYKFVKMIKFINRTGSCSLKLKPVLFVLILIFAFTSAYGQKKEKDIPPFRERLFFGGNFGLQFGTITDIQFSPVIGFWVLPRLGVAAGPNYRFYKYRNDRTDIFGGRAYMQFIFLQDLNSIIPLGVHTSLFLHGEYEALSLQSSFWKLTPDTSERFMINTFLAGAGFSQQLGRRSALYFTFLWPLNDSGYGVYSNPEIRVGFTF